MRPPRVPRSPLFASPSLPVFLATLAGLIAMVLILPMDEPARRDLEARSSHEQCYSLSYDRPINGLAALYLPAFLTLRPNGSAEILSWGAVAVDTGLPRFTHTGNWSMFGPSTFKVRYADVGKPLVSTRPAHDRQVPPHSDCWSWQSRRSMSDGNVDTVPDQRPRSLAHVA